MTPWHCLVLLPFFFLKMNSKNKRCYLHTHTHIYTHISTIFVKLTVRTIVFCYKWFTACNIRFCHVIFLKYIFVYQSHHENMLWLLSRIDWHLMYSVSHEPIFKNVVLIVTYLYLTPLHWQANTILHYKANGPWITVSLNGLNKRGGRTLKLPRQIYWRLSEYVWAYLRFARALNMTKLFCVVCQYFAFLLPTSCINRILRTSNRMLPRL